jgi:hypothetical protein
MGINAINPSAIQQAVRGKAVTVGKDFNAFLGAADAMSGAAVTAGSMYGSANAATVLGAAFSGVSALNNTPGMSGYPSMAAGYGGGVSSTGFYGYGKYSSEYMPSGIPGSSSSSSVIPGTEGFSQWDMINTMNQNNLQLLELQAVMQSNMQAWNTKSNILSADHRARMAMIEKFTARG